MGLPVTLHPPTTPMSKRLDVVHRDRGSRKAKSVITCHHKSRHSPDPVTASEERKLFIDKVKEELFIKKQRPTEGRKGYGYKVTGIRVDLKVEIAGMSQRKTFALEWTATLTRCEPDESDMYLEGEGTIVPSTHGLRASIECSGTYAVAKPRPALLPGCSRRRNVTASNYVIVDGITWSVHEKYVSAPYTPDPHCMIPDQPVTGFDRQTTLKVV